MSPTGRVWRIRRFTRVIASRTRTASWAVVTLFAEVTRLDTFLSLANEHC